MHGFPFVSEVFFFLSGKWRVINVEDHIYAAHWLSDGNGNNNSIVPKVWGLMASVSGWYILYYVLHYQVLITTWYVRTVYTRSTQYINSIVVSGVNWTTVSFQKKNCHHVVGGLRRQFSCVKKNKMKRKTLKRQFPQTPVYKNTQINNDTLLFFCSSCEECSWYQKTCCSLRSAADLRWNAKRIIYLSTAVAQHAEDAKQAGKREGARAAVRARYRQTTMTRVFEYLYVTCEWWERNPQ